VFNIPLNRSAVRVMNMVLHVKGFGCKLDFEGGAFREDQFVFGDESHGTLAAMRRKYGYADR
jgi:hypothetical protein